MLFFYLGTYIHLLYCFLFRFFNQSAFLLLAMKRISIDLREQRLGHAPDRVLATETDTCLRVGQVLGAVGLDEIIRNVVELFGGSTAAAAATIGTVQAVHGAVVVIVENSGRWNSIQKCNRSTNSVGRFGRRFEAGFGFFTVQPVR